MLLLLLLCCSVLLSGAVPENKRKGSKKKRIANADKEYSRRKASCAADSSLLKPCEEQSIDLDNCVLK